jgi:hypothetical protein
MATTGEGSAARRIRTDFDATRTSIRSLLDSFSQEDWRRQSLNPGWTNGEVMAHMVFGFVVVIVLLPFTRLWGRLPKESSRPFARMLDRFTGPFNRVNAFGARMQGRLVAPDRVGSVYNRAEGWLLKKAASIGDMEWERGVYYPTRWDANFGEFMTIEELFRYPVTHFNFHLGQIAR